MSIKLSPNKVTQLLRLYFQGLPQLSIAAKLGINQATVSLYVKEFSEMVEDEGLEAIAKEYGIMDIVKELHSLGAELKKPGLTIESAKTGLKVATVFDECGITEDQYKDVAVTCIKMYNEGFLSAAIELNRLEESSGMFYEDIIAEYQSTANKLSQAQKQLQDTNGKIASSHEDLRKISKQKKEAGQDLKKFMDQVGVNEQRLKKVEALASALKKADVPDQELAVCIERQQLLNKSGMSIDLFTKILEQANVLTFNDHGKKLLSLLSEYGNLSDTNKDLKRQNKSLTRQVAGLEQQAKLKGEIEEEIARLTAEKTNLKPQVANLYAQKDELHDIQNQKTQIMNEVHSLNYSRAWLDQEIGLLETHRDGLGTEIEFRQQKVGDLKELESKREAIIKDIEKLEAKVKEDQKRWDIYQAFLGLVLKGSTTEIEGFIEVFPFILENLKKGEYKPSTVQVHILQKLVGPELQVYRCTTCKETFRTSKPDSTGRYNCPDCGVMGRVIVDKDAADTLQAMLSADTAKPKRVWKPVKRYLPKTPQTAMQDEGTY
ncbi:hypothetical protein ACFLXA_04670 [Chloroflexota bacterium]